MPEPERHPLPQLLRAHEAILKEVTDCHTDSAGVEYDSLAERLKLIDAMAAPSCRYLIILGRRTTQMAHCQKV